MMTHFTGRPQKPSFSFSSLSGIGSGFGADGVDVLVGATLAADFFSLLPCSHEERVSAKAWPWVVAILSSSSVGWREPSAPAKEPAPQGEPP